MGEETYSAPAAGSPSSRKAGGSKLGLTFLTLLALVAVGAGVYFWKFAGKAAAADEPALDCGGGVKLELVRVPAGEFIMGSPDDEPGRDEDSEGPRHLVKIARGFFVGKFEVTEAQWKAVMGYKAATDLPAGEVDWYDCQKFCSELSKRTGRKVRLPSEAEWEYVCRAGTSTPFWSGPTLAAEAATFDCTTPYNGAARATTKPTKPLPVGQGKRANAFGVFDTHGGVWEWCQDVYHESYKGAPADGSAWMEGAADASTHAYRGGGFSNGAAQCRSAIRYAGAEVRQPGLGMRVVVDLISK